MTEESLRSLSGAGEFTQFYGHTLHTAAAAGQLLRHFHVVCGRCVKDGAEPKTAERGELPAELSTQTYMT